MATKTKSEAFLDSKNKAKEKELEQSSGGELLLLNMPAEDFSILRTIGLDIALVAAEEKQAEIDSIKGLENVYGGKTYLATDIKELCNKYDLVIARADQYHGGVTIEMAKAIKDFSENEKAHVALSINSFFVLAPREDFSKPSKGNSFTIFYRENNDESYVSTRYKVDKLIKVYSCGNDYSVIRELNYFLVGDAAITLAITTTILVIILVLCIIFNLPEATAVFSIAWLIVNISIFSDKSVQNRYINLWNNHKNY